MHSYLSIIPSHLGTLDVRHVEPEGNVEAEPEDGAPEGNVEAEPEDGARVD